MAKDRPTPPVGPLTASRDFSNAEREIIRKYVVSNMLNRAALIARKEPK